MELNEAKTIVKTLAQGINPATGEAFAPDSPYTEPMVIRALFTVHDLARPTKKPNMSVEEKRRQNLASGKPRNAGLPWTENDRNRVESDFKDGKSIHDLAKIVERTPGAIHAELIRQGLVSPEFK
jgi:hypothetical protein